MAYAAPARGVADGTRAISEREVLDVFTCLGNHKTLDTAGRLLARNGERHLKSPEEMMRIFADLPQALANSVELARRCNLEIALGKTRLPAFPTPSGVNLEQTCSIARESGLRVTASGGVSSLKDLRQLKTISRCGVDSVIVGKALYEGRFTLQEALKAA